MKKNSTDKFWFALYTKPRNEFKAEHQLIEAGITNYLPTVTLLKQWSDRKKKVTEPLLRGYIFIYANEGERLVSVEQQSIVRCVFDVGRPARIPDWQIDNLRTMLETNEDVIVHKGIVPGAKVIIKDGPFEGIIGTVVKGETGKSISVSIDLLNRSVIARLPKESSLEAIRETSN
ncbi:MAG: UpxY family transcription antiterminator [Bacteroidetes bacterium]|nr:UpxY family transcription antiterminator [Bacteroidota bacterium]